MWLKMTHNGKFGQKSGLDRVKMANFAYFSIFSPKMRLIDNFFHLLPQSISFLEKCEKFLFLGVWGCTLANFLSFLTFSNHFTPMWLKITHNCKIGQKKWLRLGQNGQFCIFFYLFCKAQPRRASVGYPFCNTTAHMEAPPTREGIEANVHLALAQEDL